MDSTAIPLGALIIASAALLMSVISTRRKASQTYTEQVESRLAQMESKVTECERARLALAEENLKLMKHALGLPQ